MGRLFCRGIPWHVLFLPHLTHLLSFSIGFNPPSCTTHLFRSPLHHSAGKVNRIERGACTSESGIPSSPPELTAARTKLSYLMECDRQLSLLHENFRHICNVKAQTLALVCAHSSPIDRFPSAVFLDQCHTLSHPRAEPQKNGVAGAYTYSTCGIHRETQERTIHG